MKKTKIGENEMYSIDINRLKTKYKKKQTIKSVIEGIGTVAFALMSLWVLVVLYLTITGK